MSIKSRGRHCAGGVLAAIGAATLPLVAVGRDPACGRLYFVGKFEDFRVNTTPNFGGSPDGSPALFEADVNCGVRAGDRHSRIFPSICLAKLTEATSSGNLPFLGRPSIISIERSVAAGIERASLGANAANKDYFASPYLTGPLFGAQMPNFLNSEQVEVIERLARRSYHRFGTGRLLMAVRPEGAKPVDEEATQRIVD